MNLGYYNRTINYFTDILLCRYHNMKNRLDKTDMKTLAIWSVIFFISIILSICIHKCVILVYIISVSILLAEFNRFREKNKKNSVKNTVEVVRYCMDDLKNVDIFVGRWRGKRPYMEDEHIVCPTTKIFGVFDGHGGSAASKYIKRKFTAEYEEVFHNLLMKNNYSSLDLLTKDALEKTIIKMDQDLYDRSMDSGAVGVVIKMNADKIYCTSIGDSGAYIVMKDGSIKKLSITHSLTEHSEYCRYTDTISPLKPRVGAVLRTYSGLMPTRTIGDHVYKKKDKGLLNIPETTITSIVKPTTVTVKHKQTVEPTIKVIENVCSTCDNNTVINNKSDCFDQTICSIEDKCHSTPTLIPESLNLEFNPIMAIGSNISESIDSDKNVDGPITSIQESDNDLKNTSSITPILEPESNPVVNPVVMPMPTVSPDLDTEPEHTTNPKDHAEDAPHVASDTVPTLGVDRNWSMIILGSDGIWDCVDPKDIRDMVQSVMNNHKNKKDTEMELHKNITKFMVKIYGMTVREIDMMDKLLCRYYGDNCTLMIIINSE